MQLNPMMSGACLVLAAAALIAPVGVANDGATLLAYPTDYRAWRHMKSEYWGEAHELFDTVGGLHHIYANDEAVRGFRRGRYENGAAFAFDLYDVVVEAGAIREGAHKAVFIMVRDDERFQDTGGWGYEGYGSENRTTRLVGDQAATMCHACHSPHSRTQYVLEDGFRP